MDEPRVYIAWMTGATAWLLLEDGSGEPIDAAELASAAARAWYWPEATDVVARARSGVRISAPGADGPVDAALQVTADAARRAREKNVLAVLWEPTGLVHEAAAFADQAEDATREDLPLYLWVRFEGTKGDDGTLGMYTTGLAALGAMEIETEGSKKDGEHVLECVTDVALFVLTAPSIPDDGETIEVTRGAVRVRRMPSLRGDGTTALRVRV
jgi:hypothetical protein